uniref:Uncharacterized protein n=1 Tax=Ditylenchus dipsaci TaxID=166011 RepID=A0A915E8Y2_9BILA
MPASNYSLPDLSNADSESLGSCTLEVTLLPIILITRVTVEQFNKWKQPCGRDDAKKDAELK